jgi:hypothetical protein
MNISAIFVIILLPIFKAFALILMCLKPNYDYVKVFFDLR